MQEIKIKELKEKTDENAKVVDIPKRFVDYDITSSFAHCTPNVTADEIFGYFILDKLKLSSDRKLNTLVCDYDGVSPGKEKPKAYSLENILKDEKNFPPKIQFLFQESRTEKEPSILHQYYNKNKIIENINKQWDKIIKKSGFGKQEKDIVKTRFLEIIEAVKYSVENSDSVLEFLRKFRTKCINLVGIKTCGIPESEYFDIFTQKLEEDLEAGYPFWKMELPEYFERKHKSNDSTYLFRSLDIKENFLGNSELIFNNVKFYEYPNRFEFNYKGEKRIVLAEESPKAMRDGILFPTTTLLNYIVLSPARKKTTNDAKKRIHLAGQFMAGENGYAKELTEYFNRISGYDKVSLVCTGYDGSMSVISRKRKFIGFGAIYPQFGKEGIQDSLKNGFPFSLKRSEVYIK